MPEIGTYVNLVEHAPELWGLVFKRTDDSALVQRWTRFRRQFARISHPRFVSAAAEFKRHGRLCRDHPAAERTPSGSAASQN